MIAGLRLLRECQAQSRIVQTLKSGSQEVLQIPPKYTFKEVIKFVMLQNKQKDVGDWTVGNAPGG